MGWVGQPANFRTVSSRFPSSAKVTAVADQVIVQMCQPVPAWVSVTGDVLVAAGLGIAMLVITQNSYAGATVQVEPGQQLASGGLYKFVRHPMYVGNVIMMIGIPLALDSAWGLLFVIPGAVVLALRILDEEKLLNRELAGYREYSQQVRYRLVPYVW